MNDNSEEPCALLAQARFCEGGEHNQSKGGEVLFYSTSEINGKITNGIYLQGWIIIIDLQINKFFYLPLIIGEIIERKIGNGKRGMIVYTLLYLIFSPFPSVLTNGINSWILNTLLPLMIQNYFLLGMLYVFFFIWWNKK